MATLMETVTANVQACVVSAKGGVRLKNIQEDYFFLAGESLPLKSLGFTNLESFIRSLPELEIIYLKGEAIIRVRPMKNSSTLHLTQMVSMQRSKSLSNKGRPRGWIQPLPRAVFSQLRRRASAGPAAKRYPPPPRFSVPPRFQQQQQPRSDSGSSELPLRNFGQLNIKQNIRGGDEKNMILGAEQMNRTLPLLNIQVDCPESANDKWKRRVLVEPDSDLSMTEQPRPRFGTLFSDDVLACRKTGTLYSDLLYAPTTVSRRKPSCVSPSEQAAPPLTEHEQSAAPPSQGAHVVSPSCVLQSTSQCASAYLSCGVHTTASAPALASNLLGVTCSGYNELLGELLGPQGTADVPTPIPPTTYLTEPDFLKNLCLLLGVYPHGLWSTSLPATYSAQFGESVPEDWLTLLHGNDMFQLTTVNPNKTIVELAPEIDIPLLGALPQSKFWSVVVTYVESSSVLWFRLLEHSEEVMTMMNDVLQAWRAGYVHFGLRQVRQGSTVLVKLAGEADEPWRAQVLQLFPDRNTVLCFLVDVGRKVEVPLMDVATLPPKFAKVPSQAIRGVVKKLDILRGLSEQAVMVETLWSEQLAVQNMLVAMCGGQGEEVTRDTTVAIEGLYDVKEEEDVDVIDNILVNVVQSLQPALPPLQQIRQVAVSHVPADCSVWVQPLPEVVEWLEQQLHDLRAEELPRPEGLARENLYLVQCVAHPAPAQLYRVVLGNSSLHPPAARVLVDCIDYGRSVEVGVSELRDVPEAARVLYMLPPQALQCRLRNVSADMGEEKRARCMARMRELLLPGTVVALRTLQDSEVDIFCRVQPHNLVCSINETIALDSGLLN